MLGSAQHPIALGAVLVIPIPLAVYFARTAGRRWWTVVALLLLGALATGSRTAIVMLIAMTVVFLFLKPRETRRIWPLLIPGVVIVHLVVPGAIGTAQRVLSRRAGSSQSSRVWGRRRSEPAGGRIRQLGPMLREARATRSSAKGSGRGSRLWQQDVRADPRQPMAEHDSRARLRRRAFWLWLFVRSVRRLCRASRESEDGDDWLSPDLPLRSPASASGCLFDAFRFTQITFVFWILLGLSAAMLRINEEMRAEVREFATAAGPRGDEGSCGRSRRSARRFPLVGAGASRRLAQVAIEVGSDPESELLLETGSETPGGR